MTKIALNFDEIKKATESVLNIKPFLNNYYWEVINHPSKIEDWKRFEKIIRQLLLTYYIKEKETRPAYIWKINLNCKKQFSEWFQM